MNKASLQHGCCDGCARQEDYLEQSRKILPQEVVEFIDKCLQTDHPSGQLIAVLHKVQKHHGYLSVSAMDAVAYLMQIPTAKVSGVASFYHYFRLKPYGRFVISICLGTACYVKGAEAVFNKFSEGLGIKDGETTKDGLFTLEISRCLGACALAPVVKVGDDIYSQVNQDQVPRIIKRYMDLDKAASIDNQN